MKFYNYEKPFVVKLLLSLLAVLSGWILLGWNPRLLMTAHDGALGSQTLLREFVRSAENWQQYTYLFKPLGGNLGHDIAPILPFMEWSKFLGFGAFSIEIIQVFFLQIVFSFFVILLIESIKKNCFEIHNPFTKLEFFFIAILLAFSPCLAWRIWYGHELLILGLLPLVIMCSLWAHFYGEKEDASVTVVIFAVVGLINSVPSSGQQSFIYSLIFGLPFILAMALNFMRHDKKLALRSLALALGIFFISFLIILPRFMSMFYSAFYGDSARSLKAESLTYSYVTGEFKDWLSSLTLFYHWFPQQKDFLYYHEINYGFGPLIAFFVVSFKKQNRALSIFTMGLFLSFLVSYFFTNHLIFSDTFINLIPILKIFRVPHRSILVLMSVLYAVAIVNVEAIWRYDLDDETKKKTKNTMKNKMKNQILWAGLTLSCGIGLFFLKTHYSEILIWAFTACLIFCYFFKGSVSSRFKLPFYIILATTCLSAFQERQITWVRKDEVENIWDTLGKDLLAMRPILKNPLYRAKLNFEIPLLGNNTAFGVGISQIEGYIPPLSRYSNLVSALYEKTFESTYNNFSFDSQADTFKVLENLYNVSTVFNVKNVQNDNPIEITDISSLAGPAWFPEKWQRVEGWSDLSTTLKSNLNDLGEYLQMNGVYLAMDTKDFFIKNNFELCKNRGISFPAGGQTNGAIQIRVEKSNLVTNSCVLVIATNYSKKLFAKDETSEYLETFPVYGSLLGVMVGPNTENIVLRGEPGIPKYIHYSVFIGLILLCAFLVKMRPHKIVYAHR